MQAYLATLDTLQIFFFERMCVISLSSGTSLVVRKLKNKDIGFGVHQYIWIYIWYSITIYLGYQC